MCLKISSRVLFLIICVVIFWFYSRISYEVSPLISVESISICFRAIRIITSLFGWVLITRVHAIKTPIWWRWFTRSTRCTHWMTWFETLWSKLKTRLSFAALVIICLSSSNNSRSSNCIIWEWLRSILFVTREYTKWFLSLIFSHIMFRFLQHRQSSNIMDLLGWNGLITNLRLKLRHEWHHLHWPSVILLVRVGIEVTGTIICCHLNGNATCHGRNG